MVRALALCIAACWMPSSVMAQDVPDPVQDESPPEDAPPTQMEEEVPPNVVEARERLARGAELIDQENYDAALTEFERAYDLVGDHPLRYRILFNIGKAHERLFRYDLAIEYYERYLQEGPADGEDRPAVEATLRTLEGLLATVAIESNVPAEVWVMDRRVGDAPGTVRLPVGQHVVELRADGYTAEQQQLQVAAGESVALRFELSRLAEEYEGISPAFFWGAVGLSVAAAVGGAVFGVLALVERSGADDLLDDPVRRFDADSLNERRSKVQDLALVADIFLAGAALFAGGAVVLAFLTDWGGDDGEEESEAAVAAHPILGADVAGFTIEGRF